MGGAMDLVASAKKIIVAMMHTSKNGESKLLKKCNLPLTGVGCVQKVITNLGVFEILNNSFVMTEIAQNVTLDMVREYTAGEIVFSNSLKSLWFLK